jgi:hypothetical protein
MIPHPHFLIMAIRVMVCTLLLITVFILAYLVWKKKREKKLDQWRDQLIDTLQRTIYFLPEDNVPPVIPLTFRITRKLNHPAFRQLLLDELVQAKKAFTGTAADNLVLLFNQLNLSELSIKKLNNRSWHIKARGIQELATMHQRQLVTRIYRLTNAHHELVRMEAQSAIVQLYGFEGLRFLDIIHRPISEWQQIKLLRLLSRTPGALPENAGGWLASTNDSVVIFALKLVAEHHQQQLHDQVAGCLRHPHPQVRMQAVRCLKDIYTDTTSAVLMHVYDQQTLPCQLEILETLGYIGAVDNGTFLTLQLIHGNNMQKLSAARALVKMGDAGLQYLDEFRQSEEYPWREIIQQAKTEWAA